MSRAVIVGGAGIGDYKRIRHELREDDFLIFCDGGLRHREALGVRPSLIIGDFDSHPLPEIKKQESTGQTRFTPQKKWQPGGLTAFFSSAPPAAGRIIISRIFPF